MEPPERDDLEVEIARQLAVLEAKINAEVDDALSRRGADSAQVWPTERRNYRRCAPSAGGLPLRFPADKVAYERKQLAAEMLDRSAYLGELEDSDDECMVATTRYLELVIGKHLDRSRERSDLAQQAEAARQTLEARWTARDIVQDTLDASTSNVAVTVLRLKAVRCAARVAGIASLFWHVRRRAALASRDPFGIFAIPQTRETDVGSLTGNAPPSRGLAPAGRTITAVPIVSHAPPLSRVSAAA